ncbi:MucB/RseB-like sigma(E) regulatory protein [Bisgaardia hudsonensis]|uniref:MucB/RseB-like sigma(E) regulatory protein n=2 Tax=Bisgaardia hudsonensis TaxID=109472 RepID=A0A4R2MSZ2_9PAST|nr:MucB/RseB-like sigma(E) regulatory protein [Bisgaardia hudsonensis]
MFYKLSTFGFFILFSLNILAEASFSEDPKILLKNMHDARKSLNYEMAFITTTANSIEALRYRHINNGGIDYAQLVTLDEGMQEIIQRDNVISYFQPNYQAFSINGGQIIDNFPSIMWSDIDSLAKNYDFVNFGRNRVADRIVRTIRVLPKDDFRYQYLVFIDEENSLLLRSDVLDREGNLLEQFRVVNLNMDNNLTALFSYFNQIHFPPLLEDSTKQNLSDISFNWTPTWLPEGFRLVNKSIISDNNNQIETLLYSDGLFSFNLYVSNGLIPNETEKALQQGALTIYTNSQNNKELTFIGQLPISTARRILQDIRFK